MPTQLKQTLIGTSVVGAVLGAAPAIVFVAFAFFDAGNDDHGPALVLKFDPWFLGYALGSILGGIAISTTLFGLVPWLVHTAISRFVARRTRA
jgi:hypothetical protein